MPDPTHEESSSPESHRSLRSLPGHSSDKGQDCCEAEYEFADGSGLMAVCERPRGHDEPHLDPVHEWEWPRGSNPLLDTCDECFRLTARKAELLDVLVGQVAVVRCSQHGTRCGGDAGAHDASREGSGNES